MKKMRLIAAGLLAAICLTACGGQGNTEEAPDAAQEETAAPEETQETEDSGESQAEAGSRRRQDQRRPSRRT